MGSLNRCCFIGNLGKDPELRYLANGKAVANVSIACNETWKDASGEKQERTEWVSLSFFDKLAEIVGEYCEKGGQIYVEGRMQTRKWEDKEGNDRYSTGIVCDKMVMLGSKQGGAREEEHRTAPESRRQAPAARQGAAPRTGGGASFDDMDDDIPF